MAESTCKTKCPETCGPCDPPQLARNHYFTGKLLVERDFTDEQRYHIDKRRRHNRVLHGWGTACGLKVTQHPQEQCRDRFVIVEPGVAFDCCGREILVRCDEHFDFRRVFLEKWQQAQLEAGLPVEDDAEPTGEHDFQICLRYRECPSEEVPALFDECGCADSACEPNRILESFELDLLLDPDLTPQGPAGKHLDWECTLNLAHAFAVVPHEASDRIYVLAGDAPSPTLYALAAANQRVVASRVLTDQEPLDLAVSTDGSHLYLATLPSGAADPEVQVLESEDLGAAPVSLLAITGAGNGAVRLGATADRRLWAASPEQDVVLVWGSDIHTDPAPAAPTEVDVGNRPVDVAVAAEGSFVYVANLDGSSVSAIATSDLAVTELELEAGVRPIALDVASTVAGDNLAVIDADAARLYLVGHRPDQADPAVPLGDPVSNLAHPPLDVVISPGGAWVYLLELDPAGERGYLQAADARRLEQGLEDPLGPARFVGERPRRLELGAAGGRLYVAYAGDDSADSGGVAVIEALAEECCDLDRALEPCPECANGGECLVLATVEGYTFGDQVVDPAADKDAALPDGRVALDNRKGRRILASTQLLTEIVQCLCDRGGLAQPGEPGPPGDPGQPGDPGEPGDPGADGLGIDDVTVEFVDCDQPGGAVIVGDDPRVLELTIPTCCRKDLTHVCGISWRHGQVVGPETLDLQAFFPSSQAVQEFLDNVRDRLGAELFDTFDLLETGARGVVLAFDRPIRAGDVHAVSLRIEALVRERADEVGILPPPWRWVELHALPLGVHLQLAPRETDHGRVCDIEEVLGRAEEPDEEVNGAALLFSINSLRAPRYQVTLRGDLVRDKDGVSIDGNHLAPWLPNRSSGDGVPGGLFLSWFDTRRLNPNNATAEELAASPNITRTVAENIVARRQEAGPFATFEDLLDVSGVREATLRKIRPDLTLLEPAVVASLRATMGDPR